MTAATAPGGDHRKYVGPPDDYDLMAGLQFGLLFALGLRQHHRLADVGCGSLRAGRLLIPYLDTGHYYGLEPNRWLVDAGIAQELGQSVVELKQPHFADNDRFDLSEFGTDFDYVLAQSIFSHTYADLTATAFAGVRSTLAPNGLFVATFFERRRYAPGHANKPDSGHGFLHPGVVGYRWKQISELLDGAGLVGCRVNWLHPRQVWFVAARRGDESALGQAHARARHALRAIPRRRRITADVRMTAEQWRRGWRRQVGRAKQTLQGS